jgi:hypothetical protein
MRVVQLLTRAPVVHARMEEPVLIPAERPSPAPVLLVLLEPLVTVVWMLYNDFHCTLYKRITALNYNWIIFTVADPCTSSPCQNGGTCTKTSGTTFTCACTAGFTGATCDSGMDALQ